MQRGGSWNNNPANVRCSNRNNNTPGNRNNNIGFRLSNTIIAPNVVRHGRLHCGPPVPLVIQHGNCRQKQISAVVLVTIVGEGSAAFFCEVIYSYSIVECVCLKPLSPFSPASTSRVGKALESPTLIPENKITPAHTGCGIRWASSRSFS